MAGVGLNVPADGRALAADLQAFHATWARVVARRELDLTQRFHEYLAAGVQIMLTFDRTSVEAFASAGESFSAFWRRYAPLVSAWQIGNEPDLESEASWTMTQEDIVDLGRTARQAMPSAHLVGPGLASGQPTYLDGADLSWCDTIAIHPYLRDAPNPTDLEDLPDVDQLVADYRRFGKPIIISEWGWWGTEEGRASVEVHDLVTWAGRTSDIGAFFYFAMLDDVPPFGLVDTQGRRKPRGEAFVRAAGSAMPNGWPRMTSTPTPPSVPTDAEFQAWSVLWQAVVKLPYTPTIAGWAIPTYWREHFRDLGSPLGPEIPYNDGSGATVQPFASGLVKWTGSKVERLA